MSIRFTCDVRSQIRIPESNGGIYATRIAGGTYDGKIPKAQVSRPISNASNYSSNKTPAKHRDIFRLIKKSGGGGIRTHNLLIDSN